MAYVMHCQVDVEEQRKKLNRLRWKREKKEIQAAIESLHDDVTQPQRTEEGGCHLPSSSTDSTKGGFDNMENAKQKRNIEKLERMPCIESYVSMSKDGKWIIHRTVITDIRAKTYYEKVLSGQDDSEKPEGGGLY